MVEVVYLGIRFCFVWYFEKLAASNMYITSLF